MLFKVAWLREKAFWSIADSTGVESERGQLFVGDEVEAVMFVGCAEMNPERVGCGGGALPLRRA
jgi:hypothetical protein